MVRHGLSLTGAYHHKLIHIISVRKDDSPKWRSVSLMMMDLATKQASTLHLMFFLKSNMNLWIEMNERTSSKINNSTINLRIFPQNPIKLAASKYHGGINLHSTEIRQPSKYQGATTTTTALWSEHQFHIFVVCYFHVADADANFETILPGRFHWRRDKMVLFCRKGNWTPEKVLSLTLWQFRNWPDAFVSISFPVPRRGWEGNAIYAKGW